MDPIFTWLEDSALSVWVRESESVAFGFPGILSLHTLGMGFLVGTNGAIDLRILGVAPRVPLAPMERFLPIFWIALAVNVASGILLLIAYPTKALTNPLFYIKLGAVALGVLLLKYIRDEVFRRPGGGEDSLRKKAKLLAAASLLCWVVVIFAGRFLAYTYTRLLVDSPVHGF